MIVVIAVVVIAVDDTVVVDIVADIVVVVVAVAKWLWRWVLEGGGRRCSCRADGCCLSYETLNGPPKEPEDGG